MIVPVLYIASFILKPERNHLALRYQTTLINSEENHSLIYDIILSNTQKLYAAVPLHHH